MNLTSEQRGAVETDALDVLVCSGAGAGKTRVMCARIEWLIEHRGVSPSEIICLTFTRRAAGELIGRIEKAIGAQQVRGMLVGTFHSVALKILKAEGAALGYIPDQITVLDGDDSTMLLRTAAEALGYAEAKGKLKAPLSWERLDTFLDSEYTGRVIDEDWATSPALGKIIRHYWSLLLEYNTLDYGSILKQCRILLGNFPEVLRRYRERIKWCCLDEAQDLNMVQWGLLDMFCPPASLFAVGDVRQAIMAFQGGRVDLMVSRISRSDNEASCAG